MYVENHDMNELVMNDVIKHLKFIILKIQTIELVYIATDGAVPETKILTQREVIQVRIYRTTRLNIKVAKRMANGRLLYTVCCLHDPSIFTKAK